MRVFGDLNVDMNAEFGSLIPILREYAPGPGTASLFWILKRGRAGRANDGAQVLFKLEIKYYPFVLRTFFGS